jgi:TetR/AcrR family transcriptional repressor of nem operon
MGRKKSYDRDELIDKAVVMFHDHGFAGTSAEMLSEHLGVNRYGIYAEFGSKQGLFEAALQRYDENTVGQNFGPLEAPDAGIEEIRALVAFFGTTDGSPALGRGCFICNTAVEFGPSDPGGSGFVQRYFERLSKAFYSALSNAFDRGEIANTVNTQEEADFFTASVLGLAVMLRAKAPANIVQNAARTTIRHLEELRAKPRVND